MKRLSSKSSWLVLCFLVLQPVSALTAEGTLAYQGTHILTYSTMGRLAEGYRKLSGVTVEVMGGGCSDGVVAVTTGRAEMGGLCCPLKPEEEENLIPHTVAKDIKVAIVNFINPVPELSSAQLRAIHQGKITNWRELGWIDRPIAVIYRKHCLDRREPVRTYLQLDDELRTLAPKAIVVRTDMQLIDYVRKFPTAIGITSAVFVKERKEDINLLRLDGATPTAANVEAGRYPFAADMQIVTHGKPDPATRKFLEFIKSAEGRKIVRENLAGAP
ncbi:MAG: substrate-binding domain-containing protein [Desulfurivibrionaceae bacterium]|nr:substrate-binding domain-containing protein [Desulfurivibrionaceae bacterium]